MISDYNEYVNCEAESEEVYEIIGRCTEGSSIIGYVLSRNNRSALVKRDEVERLALENKVSNAKVQIYKNRLILKGNGTKLNTLPKYDSYGRPLLNNKVRDESIKFKIISRIMDNKTIAGYELIMIHNGDVIDSGQYSKERVIEFIKAGYITNARVQQSGGKDIVRGINCDIAKLPSKRLVHK